MKLLLPQPQEWWTVLLKRYPIRAIDYKLSELLKYTKLVKHV